MSSCIPGVLPDEEVLNHGDLADLLPGIPPQSPDCANTDNFHACLIRGLLDTKLLRSAVDALQQRHPRMQACFYANPWTGYNYLRKCTEKIPLEIRAGNADTINKDLEEELKVPIDAVRGPWCRISYIQHLDAGTGLLIFHQNHGVGDGRCCEIVLSHLLKLYDGQPVPFFNNVKSLSQMRTVSHEKLTKWHRISEQMPRSGPNAVFQTFVEPKHPEFSVKFEGICIEIVRLDAPDTQRLLQACRRNNATVTSAVAAAVTYAVMAELSERRRTSEFITIGMTMNERGRSLGPEFDEEAGNLVGDIHINCEPSSNFWESAARIANTYNQILKDDCVYEAMASMASFFEDRNSMSLLNKATPDHLVDMFGSFEHTNIASFGVLKRYGKYKDFEVIENYALSHAIYLGTKVNVCTNASSGKFTASVMATRNVVPHARELALKLRDHIQAVLKGISAAEGSPENTRMHDWCRYVAVAMEKSAAKRRDELALAPKGNNGTVFQGDVRGTFSCTSHVKLGLCVLFTLIAGGGLAGFPIYVMELKKAGVFSYTCGPGVRICDSQDAALQSMYAFSQPAQFAFGVLTGYGFDILGARWSAVAGAAMASCAMFVLGCLICLDSHAYPMTQTVMMYTFYIVGDLGGYMASFAILGWMWHYPCQQSFVIGLENGCLFASSMFGILFVWMTAAGYPLYQGFWLIAFTNVIAAFGFYKCTPTKQEFFQEAGKVLDRHANSLDPGVFAGWVHLKAQLRNLWGVFKLFFIDNFVFWLIWPVSAAPVYWWLGGFMALYGKWFDQEESVDLLNFFTAWYSALSILLNPFAGLVMDLVGMKPYLFMCSVIYLVIAFLMNIRSVVAQKLFILGLAAAMGLVNNCQQKWIAVYGPPELFGIWLGIAGTWFSFVTIFLEGFIGPNDIVLAQVLYAVGGLLMLATAVIMAACGMPKYPPRHMYESPAFLRDRADSAVE